MQLPSALYAVDAFGQFAERNLPDVRSDVQLERYAVGRLRHEQEADLPARFGEGSLPRTGGRQRPAARSTVQVDCAVQRVSMASSATSGSFVW